MNQSQTSAPQANPSALLPILLFLVVYLGNGIFFEYIRPEEGQMGFYVVSVVLALLSTRRSISARRGSAMTIL